MSAYIPTRKKKIIYCEQLIDRQHDWGDIPRYQYLQGSKVNDHIIRKVKVFRDND